MGTPAREPLISPSPTARSTSAASAPRLTADERATGLVVGAEAGAEPLPAAGTLDPRAALATVVREALRRPPCGVSFSGGRDSSALLALAVRVARDESLPAPVALTLRFPDVASTKESDWQERVAGHLRLEHWERITITSELDFLGDLATGALRHGGLFWPANAHAQAPLLARVAGGGLITGLDGDGLFGRRFAAIRAALARPGPPAPRAIVRALLAVSPARLRAARARRADAPDLPWLTPPARARVAAALADEAASEPVRWDRRIDWYARRRYLTIATASFDRFADDHDARILHPFMDRRVLAALAAHGGRGGPGTRTAAMRGLFGDLLPAAVLERRSKAEFGRAFWGPKARSFAAQCSATALDASRVDAGRLRSVCERENPPLAAGTVLQDAWLASVGSERGTAGAS